MTNMTTLKALLIEAVAAPGAAAIAAIMDPLIAAQEPPPPPPPTTDPAPEPAPDPAPSIDPPPPPPPPVDAEPAPDPTPPIAGAVVANNAAELIAELKVGKPIIFLKPGDFGAVSFNDLPGSARIISEIPGAAVFRKMQGSKVNNLTFEDIGITGLDTPADKAESIVRFGSSCTGIRFVRPIVKGASGAETCETWDAAKWLSLQRIGIWLEGDDCHVQGGKLRGMGYHAIMLTGADSSAVGNACEWFAGDFVRLLGDRSRMAKNKARNRVRPAGPNAKGDTHADGGQSWARQNAATKQYDPVDDTVWEDNLILEWDGPSHPLQGYCQGLGLFDGPYRRTTIRRNSIWTTAGHGIAVNGGDKTSPPVRSDDVICEDNVIGHLLGSTAKKSPWIRFDLTDNVKAARNVCADLLIGGTTFAAGFRKIDYARDRKPDFDAWPTA